jgi:hypothetical protein
MKKTHNAKQSGATIKDEKLQIMQHSLGLDQYGRGTQFRNHFVTGDGSSDWPLCNELVEQGLMTVRRNHHLSGSSDCFWVTDAGKKYVLEKSPKPPKESKSRARYQRFLEYGYGFRSFIDYCRWDAEPEKPWNRLNY